jgi:hypothetical protein
MLNEKYEKKLNGDILRTTLAIEEKFPELVKCLGEMPVKISDTTGHEKDVVNLYDYYTTLAALLNTYTLSDGGSKKVNF